MTVLTVELRDSAGTVLSDLANAFGVSWQEPLNDVGSGQFSLPLDDPARSLVRATCEVWCALDGAHVFTWVLDHDPTLTTIAEGEEGSETVAASGRSDISLLEQGRVYPYKGTDVQVLGAARIYSFASPDFPDAGSWGAAVQGLRQDVIDPIRHATIEYTYVSDTGLPDSFDLVPAPAPLGWSVPEAYWIWGTPSDASMTPGFNYFRASFTLAASTAVTIAATADDNYTLYLDGDPILGDLGDIGDTWAVHKRAKIPLPAGTYTLAAVAENQTLPGIAPVDNPAGFLCAVYSVNEDDSVGTVFKVSDDSWTALAYPADVPGWTPGEILLDAVAEAQARGALAGFSLDFTATADSAGQPWAGSGGAGSYVPGFTIPIGGTVLDILNALRDQGWLDYRVSSTTKTLQAFNQGGASTVTGVTLVAADPTSASIISQTFTPQSGPTTALFVKWTSGYFELADAGAVTQWGRREGFVTIEAEGESDARRQAQLILDEQSQPISAIVVAMGPSEWSGQPYVDFQVGDYIGCPNEAGVNTSYRVHAITVAQNEMGDAEFTLELNARVQEREREQFKLFSLLGNGIVGNTKVRNAVDKTTGLTTSG